MLQRIQTFFMTIGAISMILVLFFPIWEKSDTNFEAETREYAIMDAFELRYEQHLISEGTSDVVASYSTMLISVGAMLSALVMFFSITRYKKRMTQVKLNALFSLLVAATFVGIYFYSSKGNALFDPHTFGTYLAGFYLPIIALFNNFIANRFIRKDEMRIRNADRIR